MPLAIPKILVVADPPEQRELVSLLRGAGPPFSEAVIASGDGDDQTLGQFEQLRPTVVVVTATLAAGDTRSLVGAMREAATRGVFVVLLGDERGPVRNALDALDFGCDRFVARPVAVKALRFAVMSGLGTTGGPRTAGVSAGQVAGGAATFTAADAVRTTTPMPAVRATEPMAAVRVTEQIPAVRVTEPMAAVWGQDAVDGAAEAVRADAARADADAARRATAPMAVPRVTTPMAAARVTAPMAAVDAAVDALAPIEPIERGAGGDAPAPIEPIEPSETAVTTPVRAPSPSLSAQRRRWETLADAIAAGAGDDDDDDDGDIDEPAIITARPPPAPRAARVMEELDAHDHADVDEIELDDQELDDLSIDEPVDLVDDSLPEGDSPVVDLPQPWRTAPGQIRGDASEEVAAEAGDATSDRLPTPPTSAWTPGSTDVPPVPVREPTLILTDAAAASPPPPIAGPELRLDERHDGEDAPGAWGTSQVPPADDEEDMLADVAAGVDEDLSVDLTRDPAVAEAPPSGGDFARELRRKMSAMAERLFRGGELPAAPVAIGPGHDHHTEIDLGGLVDDPSLVGPEPFDLVGGATFVGSEDHVTDAQGTEARGTAEAGDIQRGVSDAPALIARMFASEFTGRIVFRHGETEKIIHVENGRPVFARSNLARDRMGDLLLREGKITGEQLTRCRDLVRDTGRRMGEILVERGFLKRRELLPAVRRHVEDIIYSLFAWEQGEYRVVAGDGAASERIRLSRHPAAMVLEGVRRKLDHATLERLLGPPTAVVETSDREKLAAITGVADLSPEERAALAAFDGSAGLSEVARATGAGLVNVYQLAWGLHLLGLVTTRRRAGDDDGDAPALVGESDLAIDRERVCARHALVLDADYFALLGVRRDATGFEIKRAYEAARRDFAADTFPAELRKELTAELDDIAQVLDEAYQVLRDDRLRRSYVSHLRDFGEAAS